MSRARGSVPRRHLALGVALLGCSLAVASPAAAQITNINLGPSGLNLLGLNAQVPFGEYIGLRTVAFPVAGLDLYVYNGYCGYHGVGVFPSGFLEFAINGGNVSPRNFGSGVAIDGTANWSSTLQQISFQRKSSGVPIDSPNFGPNSFLGFRFSTDSGSNWNYGWLEVTWDGTDFEFFSAAYQATAGQSILAGATGGGGGGVPLPGAAGLAACGLLGLSRRRRR